MADREGPGATEEGNTRGIENCIDEEDQARDKQRRPDGHFPELLAVNEGEGTEEPPTGGTWAGTTAEVSDGPP